MRSDWILFLKIGVSIFFLVFRIYFLLRWVFVAAWALSSWSKRGCSSLQPRLLIAVASLVAEHKFYVHGLSSCSSQA